MLGNPNKTVNDILLNMPNDKHNKEIYLQAKILFNLRGKIFKKLFNKGIIRSDSNQSDIVRQEYEKLLWREQNKNQKKESDQLIPIWAKVSEEKFNLMK